MTKQGTKRIINGRGLCGESEAPPKGPRDLLCEVAGQMSDRHEKLLTRNRLMSGSSCQCLAAGWGWEGGEQSNGSDKDKEHRNAIRTCSLKSPALMWLDRNS